MQHHHGNNQRSNISTYKNQHDADNPFFQGAHCFKGSKYLCSTKLFMASMLKYDFHLYLKANLMSAKLLVFALIISAVAPTDCVHKAYQQLGRFKTHASKLIRFKVCLKTSDKSSETESRQHTHAETSSFIYISGGCWHALLLKGIVKNTWVICKSKMG